MPTPILQTLSRTAYATDGITTAWNFNFTGGYLDPSHVKAYTENASGIRNDITLTPASLIGPAQLRIFPALAAGSVLVIYRDTPKGLPLVNFTDEAIFSELSLDTNARQAVFLAAEAADTTSFSPISDAIAAASSASASALFADARASDSAASAAVAVGRANDASASAFQAAASAATLSAPRGANSTGFTPASPAATVTNVESKLRELHSITDYMDGLTDHTAMFSRAARNVPARVNIGAPESNIARAPVAYVRVPAKPGGGDWVLTSLVDVGNREIIWEVDQGAGIANYQFLNGRLSRSGQRVAGDHHGTNDYACGFTVRSNHTDLEGGAEVLGLSDANQLPFYTDRDSVGLYVDNTAPPVLADIASANYNSTVIAPIGGNLTADQVKRLRVGMIVDTKHVPKWSGFITGWSPDGSSITVSGWYRVGSGGVASTPNTQAGAFINPFTKVWAYNGNTFLMPNSHAEQASGFELGVFNNKRQPTSPGADPKVWGFDAVNLGNFLCESAFIARGSAGGFYHGLETFNCATAVKYHHNTNGFLLQAIDDVTGNSTVQMDSVGNMEVGKLNAVTPVNWDFHTSGNNNDFDTRILFSAGSLGATGQGLVQIFTTRVECREFSPIASAGSTLGSAGVRWADGWINDVKSNVLRAAVNMELGTTGVIGTPFIDFNSSGNVNDYDVRVIVSGGAAGDGQGAIQIAAKQVILPVANLANAVNDAAAAIAGTPVGGVYRNGSVLMIRVT